MKIIFIEPLFSINSMGGAQKSLFHLMLRLKEKKHDVILAIPGDSELSRKATEVNIKVEKYYLPNLLSTRITYKKYKIFNFIFAIFNIISLIIGSFSLFILSLKNKPDLLHSNQSLVSISAGLASFFLRAKCVWHIRENPSSHIGNYILKTYGILSYILSDIILVNSEFTAHIFIDTLASKKIKIVPIGINDISKIFPREKFSKKENLIVKNHKRVISTFGRVIPSKGYYSLIKATKILEEKGFLFDVNIYGHYEKNDDYFSLLNRFIKENNLKSNIEFFGYIDNVDKNIFYSDLIVAPSIEPESFGRTVIESMSAKTPIIASSLGAHIELIDNNKDGFTFEPGNEIELSEKIQILFTNEKLKNDIRLNAYKKFKNHFSIDKYVNSIETIYNNLVY